MAPVPQARSACVWRVVARARAPPSPPRLCKQMNLPAARRRARTCEPLPELLFWPRRPLWSTRLYLTPTQVEDFLYAITLAKAQAAEPVIPIAKNLYAVLRTEPDECSYSCPGLYCFN